MPSLSCCAAGVSLRKFLPIPTNSKVFPTLSVSTLELVKKQKFLANLEKQKEEFFIVLYYFFSLTFSSGFSKTCYISVLYHDFNLIIILKTRPLRTG
jgi:hypothetical protein